MEKSFWKAAMTSATAARKITPKVAIPARRAVSPSRSESAPDETTRTHRQEKNEYALKAREAQKLPICEMNAALRGLFFQKPGAGEEPAPPLTTRDVPSRGGANVSPHV